MNGPVHTARTAVVSGHGKIPIAELVVEISQVPGCGAGRLFGIEPLVVERALIQTILPAAPADELPHSRSLLIGNRAGKETRLRLSQENQFLRYAFLGQDPLYRRLVPAGASQAGSEDLTTLLTGEEMYVAENRIVFFQGELGNRRLKFFLHLRLEAGIDGKRHLQDAAVQRRFVVNHLVPVFSGTHSVHVVPVHVVNELLEAAFDPRAVRQRYPAWPGEYPPPC